VLRANDEDKGGDEGVGRWGDRGMADYAKDFHNIRRLKFSHNIRVRQHDNGKSKKCKKHDQGEKEQEEVEVEEEEEEEVRVEACVALSVLG